MTQLATRGAAIMTAVAMTTFVLASGVARADETVVRRDGAVILTGGTLDFGDRPSPRPRRASRPARATSAVAAPQSDWLYTFIDYLLDDGSSPVPRKAAPRPRRLAAPAQAPQTKLSLTEPVVPAIVTGAIDKQRPQGILPPANQDDLDASIVGEAELSQAREDLVKLELARRTYDELRLSGQSAFDQRSDWRVLERGRDAWNESELSAAVAAGFEANTYINDATRTIVVAIAGTQDLRRDFIEADIWRALIQAQAPQHFFLAKSYVRSVQGRYQAAGYHTECVGHSLGGGACAYAGSELGIRAVVLNPISAGKLGELARTFVTNYVVDGDIAAAIYALRGNEFSGDVQKIRTDREVVRQELKNRYGFLAGPIRLVRDLKNSVKVHQIDRALDIIAAHAETQRVK